MDQIKSTETVSSPGESEDLWGCSLLVLLSFMDPTSVMADLDFFGSLVVSYLTGSYF